APEARLEKLRAFWEQVTTQMLFDPFGIAHYWLRGDMGHVFLNRLRAGATLLEGAPGFFKPRIPPPYLAPPGPVEATSWYDTSPLRSTLERLVDFDRINAGEMRFSVGARQHPQRQLRVFRFEQPQDQARAHHGQRRAAARLSSHRGGRRTLLGWRA